MEVLTLTRHIGDEKDRQEKANNLRNKLVQMFGRTWIRIDKKKDKHPYELQEGGQFWRTIIAYIMEGHVK